MKKEEIESKIMEIIQKMFGNEKGFDKIESLNLVKLVIAIEDEFQIEIADEDLNADTIGSLEKLVDYVAAKIEQRVA